MFKQYYTYFYIFFYSYVFLKNINNFIKTTLSNIPKFFESHGVSCPYWYRLWRMISKGKMTDDD